MVSYNVFTVLISFIFTPFVLAADNLQGIHNNEILKLHDMTIDEYIDYINPSAVYKYKNINGDNVLCVKYEDQPALRSEKIKKDSKNNHLGYTNSTAKECMEGTVPILEISREVVESFGSVREFLNRRGLDKVQTNVVHTDVVQKDGRDHQWAVVTLKASEDIHGAKAKFNAYQISVESDDAFSSCELWFLKELHKGESSSESMQIGLQVYPKRYNHGRLTFFIYYRVNGEANGCYNLECGYFVQEGAEFYPGMAVEGLSVYNGPQKDSTISIRRSVRGTPEAIVWEVYLQEKLVGYWPAHYFNYLSSNANRVDFGGEVSVAAKPKGTPYSKTDMGTGGFPEDGYTKATFVRNIELFTVNDAPIVDSFKFNVETKKKCYGIKRYVASDWGDYIYYGGPGGDNPKCKF